MPNTLFEYLCAKCVKGANQSKRYVSRLSTLFLWTNIVCQSTRNSAEKRGIELQKTWQWAAKLQLGLAHRTVRWCTGQCPVRQTGLRWKGRSRELTTVYDYNSSDCLVVHQTVRWVIRGELVALGKRKRRRGYNSPDCPVVHRTIRWANGRQRQRSAAKSAGDTWRLQRSSGGTGQCPVRQRARSCNGRLCPIWKEIMHRTGYSSCPVAHRTVRCATRQKAGIAFQDCLQRLLTALGL
jgi:hypothetical protein